MQQLTHYENLLAEVMEYFYTHLATLEAAGVTDIIIDPGFGFAKTAEQNFLLLKHLEYFEALGRPLLAGLSRKSMVWRTLGITPDEALPGTVALQMVALQKGVSMLRVHDVREAKQDITLHQQLMLAHGNNAVNKGV
jgi:dihydropteroate synthase